MKTRRPTAEPLWLPIFAKKRPPALRVAIDDADLIVDSFAGGGGASLGIEMALGRSPDIAINHDAEAIAMHAANHPRTQHYQESVWDVDPVVVTGGRRVGLAWFSPDCKHFSRAKGGKPVSKKVRGLAWIVTRWARAVRPRVICLENVVEFLTWGPLNPDGTPDKAKAGNTFRAWKKQLENLGYVVQTRVLCAADYGAPTSRERLFLVARCDGNPIVWPEPTHGPGRPQPWRGAHEIIDWSLPLPSIFERERPLVPNTLRRIARGIDKFVLNDPSPFIVPYYTSTSPGGDRIAPITAPIATVTTENRFGLVAPFLVETRNSERDGQLPRVRDVRAPYQTITAQGSQGGVVAAFLAKHYGGHEATGSSLHAPIDTITARDHHSLITVSERGDHRNKVRALMIKYYGNEQTGVDIREPLDTVTTRDRFGVIAVDGFEQSIADIGYRMLVPREGFLGQGFRRDYVIDPWMPAHWRHDHDGDVWVKEGPLGVTSQMRCAGNSVCPDLAAALVRAQFSKPAVEVARGVA